ncbi:hypothetical protein GWI34_18465 [Actinomadura sp. DSM 109109]|nr:hypothetical protein [Actinomadura lepetitiana]
MAVSLDQLRTALSRQAADLASVPLDGHPELVAQQLLYQSRLDPSTSALAGPAAARLRRLVAERPRLLGLRTRWTTSRLRDRYRPNRGEIRALAMSANGSVVLFSADDDALYLWRPDGGALRSRWIGSLGHRIAAIDCTPTADRAVTGDHEGRVRLWVLTDPAPRPVELGVHDGYVRAARISADGAVVVSAGSDGRVLCHRPGEDAPQELADAGAGVNRLALAPDASFAVYGSIDGRLLVSTVPGAPGAPSATRQIGRLAGNRLTGIEVLPGLRHAVGITRDGFVRVWDLSGAAEQSGREVGCSGLPLHGLAVAPDGTRVFTGGADGRVLSWDLSGGADQSGHLLNVHDRSVTVLRAGTDTVISGGRDGLLLRARLGATAGSEHGHGFEVWTLHAAPSGRAALTAGKDGLHRWDLDVDGPPVPVRIGELAVRNFVPLPDGSGFAAIDRDGRIRVAPIVEGGPAERVLNAEGRYPVRQMAVCPDGQSLITGGADGFVRRWNLRSDPAAEPETVGMHGGSEIRALAVSPTGSYVISADLRRRLLRWNLDGALRPDEQRHVHPPSRNQHRIRCLAVTPDDRWLVVADDGGQVWRMGTGVFSGATRIGRHRQDAKVRAVAVSEDGRWAATVSDDGELCCWDVEGGGELTRIVPGALPRSLATAGGRLLVGDRNGGLTVFDVLEGPWQAPAPASAPAPAPADTTPKPGATERAEPPPAPRVGSGELTVVVDQWWTRHHAGQRLDFAALRTQLAAGRACAAVMPCPDLPEMTSFRRKMQWLGYVVENVPAVRADQVPQLARIVREALALGPVTLVTGDDDLLAQLTPSPGGLTVVTGPATTSEAATASGPARRPPAAGGAASTPQAERLLVEAFDSVPIRTASALKNAMLRLDPSFDEKALGFTGFRDFLRGVPHLVRIAGSSGMDVLVERVEPRDPPESGHGRP